MEMMKSGKRKLSTSSPRPQSKIKMIKTLFDPRSTPDKGSRRSRLSSQPSVLKPIRSNIITTESESPGCSMNRPENLSLSIATFSPDASVNVKEATKDNIESSSGENIEERSVKVAVRVRPFTHQELLLPENKAILRVEENDLLIQTESAHSDDSFTEVRFEFDHCFWSFNRADKIPFASQEMVYETFGRPLLDKTIEGYNACLFAYGMTSSGKSYSILGTRDDEGIIPRLSEDIFNRKNHLFSEVSGKENYGMKVEICFYEIYNERIRDLFTASHDKSIKRHELRVREHPERGPYVEGLTSFAVRSHDDVRSWLSLATKRRATAATSLNEHSSRSHAVFVFVIHRSVGDRYLTSRINVVDLAGCERQNSAGTTGVRQKEGAAINRSLLTLGRIISTLAEHGSDAVDMYKEKKIHIPYRDSTLTWLLRESLGGNSQTAMLATVSPSSTVVEETLSTLRYAAKARRVVNCARIHEDPKSRVIRELRSEITRLVEQQQRQALPSQVDIENEVSRLKQALAIKEEEMETMKRNWLSELNAADRLRREEVCRLETCGVMSPSVSATQVTPEKERKCASPALINLHADPLLNETLVYPIRTGDTIVSNKASTGSEAVICLGGPLIAERHCVLKYVNGSLRIEPLELDSGTYVNGQWIEKETLAYDGDRLVLGDHYFRVQLPPKPGAPGEGMTKISFERARTELLRGQEFRGQWLLMKQRADLEMKRLNEIIQTRDERIKALERELEQERKVKEMCASEITKLESDMKSLKEESSQKAIPITQCKDTEDVGCDCSFLSDQVEDDRNILTLWTKVTEANQICKKTGFNAYFLVRPSLFGQCQVKVTLEEKGLSSFWPIDVFLNKLDELRTAWETDADLETIRGLILQEDKGYSWENTMSILENSLNLSSFGNQSMSPVVQDDKESESERLINYIHDVREHLTNGVKEISNIHKDEDAVITSICHLNKLYDLMIRISPNPQMDLSTLPSSLLQMCQHIFLSMCILVPQLRKDTDLKIAFRKLSNSVDVLCTNLRYHVRNLQAFILDDQPESRVLEVLETLSSTVNFHIDTLPLSLAKPVREIIIQSVKK